MTARSVSVDVRGLPRPQGSLRLHTLPGGKVAARYADTVYEWRAVLQERLARECVEQFVGPVELRLGFDMPRLQSHFRPVNSKRSAPELRESAPDYPCSAPDLDKLVRAVGDSITDAGLWRDDGQVASLVAAKRYSDTPGVLITITELTT